MENPNSHNLEELKQTNPEAYFKEVLCNEDFKELQKLHTETNGKIDWKVLVKNGVCKIDGDKLVGIDWPGDLNLGGCKNLTSLGKLTSVGGDLNLWGCENLTSLGELTSVGGDLDLYGCENLTSLGKLTSVGGNLYLSGCENLTSLGILTSVGGDLDLYGCKNLTSLGELTSVLGYLDLRSCENLTSLGKLTSVGGDLDLYGCENLTSLGILTSVGGDLALTGCKQELQLEGYIKWKKRLLKAKKLIIDDDIKILFEKYYTDNNLNYEIFKDIFGTDITKIEDEEYKEIAKLMLKAEYKILYKETKEKLKEIVVGKTSLTKEEEKQIIEINDYFAEKEAQIKSFGIKVEEIDVSDM